MPTATRTAAQWAARAVIIGACFGALAALHDASVARAQAHAFDRYLSCVFDGAPDDTCERESAAIITKADRMSWRRL